MFQLSHACYGCLCLLAIEIIHGTTFLIYLAIQCHTVCACKEATQLKKVYIFNYFTLQAGIKNYLLTENSCAIDKWVRVRKSTVKKPIKTPLG